MRILSIVVTALAIASCHSPGAASEAAASPAVSPQPEAKTAPAAALPATVLVELFTSQGCSSCPPADRLLAEIERGALGDDVIALAFHVDYWNYLGWRDPFSAKAWSTRQKQYAKRLPHGRVYTPMLVVDGQRHVVGSRRPDVTAAVKATRGVTSPLRMSATGSIAADGSLTVSATLLGTAPEDVSLIAFAVLDGADTRVASGENAGRTLAERAIVLGQYAVHDVAKGATAAPASVRIPRDTSWPKDVGAVVIAQASSGRVFAAQRVAFAP